MSYRNCERVRPLVNRLLVTTYLTKRYCLPKKSLFLQRSCMLTKLYLGRRTYDFIQHRIQARPRVFCSRVTEVADGGHILRFLFFQTTKMLIPQDSGRNSRVLPLYWYSISCGDTSKIFPGFNIRKSQNRCTKTEDCNDDPSTNRGEPRI